MFLYGIVQENGAITKNIHMHQTIPYSCVEWILVPLILIQLHARLQYALIKSLNHRFSGFSNIHTSANNYKIEEECDKSKVDETLFISQQHLG